MSTLSVITAFINSKIRNKTPEVVKVEHADVEQLLANEFFPASVKVEWNGTAIVAPTSDIVVFPSIASGIIKFTVYFWKSGNTVYVNGKIENIGSLGYQFLQLIDFATAIYKPLTTSPIYMKTQVNNSFLQEDGGFSLKASDSGISLVGTINPGINSYSFNGTYKVAN